MGDRAEVVKTKANEMRIGLAYCGVAFVEYGVPVAYSSVGMVVDRLIWRIWRHRRNCSTAVNETMAVM